MHLRPHLATRTTTASLVAATALLAGCGSTSASSPPAAAAPPTTSLTISAQASADGPAQTWTLTCDPAGGTHPHPGAACAALAAAKDPFAPVPADVACTEIYGGPQLATVDGTFDGAQVQATFNRTNGCEIARWEALAPLLVVHGGVDPAEVED